MGVTLGNAAFSGFLHGAAWLACVGGAASERPLAGPACVALLLIVHTWRMPRPMEQLRPVLVLGVVGTVIDSISVVWGIYLPAGVLRDSPICPLWLTALWINFAMFLQATSGLGLRPSAASILLGGAGLPAAYVLAYVLGAITVLWSPLPAITFWAASGAVIFPAALAALSPVSPRQLDRPDSDPSVADNTDPPRRTEQ